MIIAVKPKYPNRKVADKVLYNEGNLLTLINAEVTKKVLENLATSFVAIVYNNQYYPVSVENYVEQFNLVKSSLAPTVSVDANFGIKKIENFVTTSSTAICKVLQEKVEIYNGIIKANLFKVVNYASLGDAKITKNGYWFVFNFDLASATTEGYSALKLNDGTALVSGDNYVFAGDSEEKVASYIFKIYGKLTKDQITEDVSEVFVSKFNALIWNEKDAIPAITVDGKEFATLTAAFDAIKSIGGTVEVNKSITEGEVLIELNTGKEFTLKVNNGATVSLGKNFEVSNGSTLHISGEGIVKETTANRSPVVMVNLVETSSSNVIVDKGITLMGWAGLFLNKASYNLNAIVNGDCIGQNDGTDDGHGIYVNGVVNSGSLVFTGSTAGTAGIGIFQSGNINTTITNATVSGSESGIEVRAGSVIASGSKFESLSTAEATMTPNGNGSTSTAVGFAIAQHTTKKPIKVTIDNCTVTGTASIMEGNPQGNPQATADTTIIVNSGVYIGEVKTLAADTDCKNFLYGGKYKTRPNDTYIATGYTVKENLGVYDIVKA